MVTIWIAAVSLVVARGLFLKSVPVLRKAFEVPGPVLIGIRVDYRDNHILFDHIHEHLLT
jgi:hypothetical protein